MVPATRKDVDVPAPHPVEFRRRAVKLARLGEQPIAALAKQLSISKSCLRNWMAQADADENGSDSRSTSAEKRELTQLRRDKRRLEMENEILKRAAAYFAPRPLRLSSTMPPSPPDVTITLRTPLPSTVGMSG
ncbi:MAG: transposase [Pseudonocardiaceae bacterium]